MSTRKPNPLLRNVLAEEEVVIFSDSELKSKPTEKLDTAIEYYSTTLETLAGEQVWDILDSLYAAQNEKRKRLIAKQ